jgi:hypothetical protein
VTARERYLLELERRLPFALGLRGRALSEIREHLREGGDDALARIGRVEELASELGRELRIRAAARASWLIPLLVALFVVPFYVVPENTLPPAPWDVKPDYLAWKQHTAVGAWLAALGLAVAGLLIGRMMPRLAVLPLIGAVAALGVAVVFGSVVAVQWIDAVPGTSAGLTYAGIAASVLLTAAGVLVLVEASRALLPDRRNELAAD